MRTSATVGAAVGRHLAASHDDDGDRRLDDGLDRQRHRPQPRQRRAERGQKRNGAREDLGRSNRPKRSLRSRRAWGTTPKPPTTNPSASTDRIGVKSGSPNTAEAIGAMTTMRTASTPPKVAATTSWLATNEAVRLASRRIAGPAPRSRMTVASPITTAAIAMMPKSAGGRGPLRVGSGTGPRVPTRAPNASPLHETATTVVAVGGRSSRDILLRLFDRTPRHDEVHPRPALRRSARSRSSPRPG